MSASRCTGMYWSHLVEDIADKSLIWVFLLSTHKLKQYQWNGKSKFAMSPWFSRVIQNSLTSLRISDSLIYTESLLFFFSSLALSGTAEAQPFARVKQMMRELTHHVQQQQSLHMPCAIMFTVRLMEQRKSSSHFKDRAPGSVYLPRF